MSLTTSGIASTGSFFSASANGEYVVQTVLSGSITIGGLMLSIRSNNGSLPSAKIKSVIYNADATPDPTTLVVAGTEVVGVHQGLLWLPFGSSQTLTAGTYFWGFHVDTNIITDAIAFTGYDRRYRSRTYTSGPIDPFGTPDGTGTEGITIFAVSGTGLAVAKAHELALLAYPAGISIAKAYDLLLLQDGSVAPAEPRPQGMIIT
jgi:hypothetical protein